MSITKQLIINQLPIPHELCDIVKEYIFYDTIMYNVKQKKNKIMQLINNATWSGKRYESENIRWYYVFCINKRLDATMFYTPFCMKCGNYKSIRYSKRIECWC
jgi:hypothetical protein